LIIRRFLAIDQLTRKSPPCSAAGPRSGGLSPAGMFLAADKLRKNLEPSDYKHVALGLIFLKHISNAKIITKNLEIMENMENMEIMENMNSLQYHN
jgi:hypothetical protein